MHSDHILHASNLIFHAPLTTTQVIQMTLNPQNFLASYSDERMQNAVGLGRRLNATFGLQ